MIAPLAVLLLLAQGQIMTPVDHPGAASDLAAQVEAACPISGATNQAALMKAELAAATAAGDRKATATQWTDLACLRARLSQTDAFSHEGLLMVTGTSWGVGSINAAMRALLLDEHDARAAAVLAVMALNEAQPKPLSVIASALVDAVHAGVQLPAVWRGCADLALRAGNVDGSRECARAALAAGVDSTWHLLRLARISFREADTTSGGLHFGAAAGAAHDSVARLEVEWHLQWFLSPLEREVWDTLPDSHRADWLRDLLASRDVRDGQPAGARLAEHFSRLEYVEEHFRLNVPKNRRRAATTLPAFLLKPPGNACDTADFTTQSNQTGVCDPLNQTIDKSNPNGAAEPGDVPARPFRDYARWQVDYDDRGVVWMRFGAPTKRVPWVGQLTVREAWLYEIDGKKMILNFEGEDNDGSAEATRLVTGVLGSYLCDVDNGRCGLTIRAQNGELKPEQLETVRQQDREAVTVATTKDDNSVRAAKYLDMVAQLHRLWDPATGREIAVVSYALRLNTLTHQESSEGRTALVDLAVRQYDPTTGQWSDTAVYRHLKLPNASSKNSHVTGAMVIPSSFGVRSWSVAATQPDDRVGRAFEEGMTPIVEGPLMMSDLVLGAPSQDLSWATRSGRIALAPLGALDRKKGVQLYYQVHSDVARSAVKTTVVLYRTDRGSKSTTPVLQLGFTGTIRRGLNEVEKELDVSHIDGGSYRLEVQLADASGAIALRQSTMLYLK